MPIRTTAGTQFYVRERVTRLSTRKGEYGNKAYLGLWPQVSDIVIRLNGKVIEHCIAADAVAGFVDCCVQRNGRFVLNPFKDSVAVYRLYGDVEILC